MFNLVERGRGGVGGGVVVGSGCLVVGRGAWWWVGGVWW